MNKQGNNSLQDDNLQGHNAELINSKFSDPVSDSIFEEEAQPETDTVIPKTQKTDGQD